jgi:hypothetical protein
MTTTYVSNAALDQLQIELERHLVSDLGGRCDGCGDLEPCAARQRISTAFTRYGCLPRRRPGWVGSRVIGTFESRSFSAFIAG